MAILHRLARALLELDRTLDRLQCKTSAEDQTIKVSQYQMRPHCKIITIKRRQKNLNPISMNIHKSKTNILNLFTEKFMKLSKLKKKPFNGIT